MSQPGGSDGEPADPLESESRELFYRGSIARFSRSSETGSLRSASGREIAFDLQNVTLLGELRRAPGGHAIEVGLEVGYDVGWTSRGLRVTKLFAAPAAVPGRGACGSQRQAGQEGEVPAEQLTGEHGERRDVEEPGRSHGLGDGENAPDEERDP